MVVRIELNTKQLDNIPAKTYTLYTDEQQLRVTTFTDTDKSTIYVGYANFTLAYNELYKLKQQAKQNKTYGYSRNLTAKTLPVYTCEPSYLEHKDIA